MPHGITVGNEAAREADRPLDAHSEGLQNQGNARHHTLWTLRMLPFSPPRSLSLLTLSLAVASSSIAQQALSPAAERLKKDVFFLADDEREGRLPGTKGIEQAADFIAARFKDLGLKPAPGAHGYFQPFDVQGGYALSSPAKFVVTDKDAKEIAIDTTADFAPQGIGSGGILNDLPVVFAGFGITAKEPTLKLDFDEYEGLDVKGKVVLVVRRSPRHDDPNGPFSLRKDDQGNVLPGRQPNVYPSFSHKVTNANAHGAKAVLIVNDRGSLKDGKDELPTFDGIDTRRYSNIPVAFISRRLADRLLTSGGQPTLEAFENGMAMEMKTRSAPLAGLKLDLALSVERKKVPAKNVVGVLEGAGPFADETIVVGAHYDHVGRGEYGSLAGSKEIHNGADDNASGTATVLEMARRLAARTDPLPRRVVFMTFSAEEAGLLGSLHYVNNPLYPLDKTIFMMNFDMVGRLADGDSLHVYGSWTSPGMDELVEAISKTSGFQPKIVSGTGQYFSASDHASFFQKGLPVLFFFTNVHPDYHRPTDDADKINYPGMARIVDMGELLLLDMARRPERPEFLSKPRPKKVIAQAPAQPQTDPHAAAATGEKTPAAPGAEPGGAVSSAYLGSIPDYGDESSEEGKGVRLSGVMEGSPAAKAGLKKGDVVVKFGGKGVGTLQDYTEYLKAAKPGDKIEIVVKRDGKDTTVSAVLGTRGAAAKQ